MLSSLLVIEITKSNAIPVTITYTRVDTQVQGQPARG